MRRKEIETVKKGSGPEVRVRANVAGPSVLFRSGSNMLQIPERIDAEVVGLPWKVTFTVQQSQGEDPVPEFTDLRISQRPGGVPISPDVIRLFRLGDAGKRAVEQAAMHYVDRGGQWVSEGGRAPDFLVSAATRKRYRRVTDDVIQQAVDAYREAKRQGRRDHLMFVAEACHVSRATADRYLRRAAEQGLMDQEED